MIFRQPAFRNSPDEPEAFNDIELKPGCGVKFQLEGTRYLTEGTITSVDEAAQTVEVKGNGFTARMLVSGIREAFPKDANQYRHIIVSDGDKFFNDDPSYINPEGLIGIQNDNP